MSQMECTCKNEDHNSCNGIDCDCPNHRSTIPVDLNKEKARDIADTTVSNYP